MRHFNNNNKNIVHKILVWNIWSPNSLIFVIYYVLCFLKHAFDDNILYLPITNNHAVTTNMSAVLAKFS